MGQSESLGMIRHLPLVLSVCALVVVAAVWWRSNVAVGQTLEYVGPRQRWVLFSIDGRLHVRHYAGKFREADFGDSFGWHYIDGSQWNYTPATADIPVVSDIGFEVWSQRVQPQPPGFIRLHDWLPRQWTGQKSLIAFPYWFPAALFAIAPLRRTGSLYQLTQRPVDGRCVECGYDLRGSPACCPECGLVPGIKEAVLIGPCDSRRGFSSVR